MKRRGTGGVRRPARVGRNLRSSLSREFVGALLLVYISAGALNGGPVLGFGDNSAGQLNFPTNLDYNQIAAGGFQSVLAQRDGPVNVYAVTPATILSATNGSSVVALASGYSHGLALLSDGTLLPFGSNEHGQTNVPFGATNFIAIGAGAYHSLGVLPDQTVISWGDNYQNYRLVPLGLSNVIAVAGGYYHSLALRSDGTVTAWGLNQYGQLSIPSGLSNVVAIAAGSFHSVALRKDGTVVAWGRNDHGQCAVPASATNIVAIAAAYQNTLALRENGSVLAWGDGSERIAASGVTNAIAIAAGYQHALYLTGAPQWPAFILPPVSVYTNTGANVVFDSSAVASFPVQYQWQFDGQDLQEQTNQVLQLSNVQPDQAGLYRVIASAKGYFVSAQVVLALEQPTILQQPVSLSLLAGQPAMLSVEAVSLRPLSYQWQFNGQVLAGATNNSLALPSGDPTETGAYQVVVLTDGGSVTSNPALVTVLSAPAILTGPANALAIINDTVAFSVATSGTAPLSYQWFFNGIAVPQATNSNFMMRAAASGEIYVVVTNLYGSVTSATSSLQVTLQKGVFVWGDNSYSESNVPPNLGELSQLACGVFRVMALKTNGSLVDWGRNIYGESSVPPGLTNIIAVSGASHNLALNGDGTVVSWGYNGQGQTNVPTGLSNVVAVSAGTAFSVALKSDGTVVAWGDNSHNQTNVPAVATNIIAVAAGEFHSVALRSDGTLVTWGQTNPPYHLPPTGLSNVVAIAAGYTHSLALRADGTVIAWGMNDAGQLSMPSGLSNVVGIAAGAFDGLALRNDGTLVGLGDYFTGLDFLPNGLTNVALFSVGVAVGAIQYGPPAWPVFTQPPLSQVASNGDTVTFSAQVAAPYPLSYQWQFNGANLPGQTTAVLMLTNVEPGNAGTYRIIARAGRFVSSANAELALNTPVLVLSASTDQSVLNGSDSSLFVSVVANSPVTYQWQFNGTNLAGQTNAGLMLTNFQSIDAGPYSVLVSAGSATMLVPAGRLSVTYPPVADPTPRSISVEDGSTVVLQAVATEPGPFSYQWTGLGAGPSSTNSTLALTNVSFSGQYVVIIGNKDGSATNVFNLTVELPPNAIADWTDYSPVILPYATNVVSLSAGYQHSLAALADGTVQAYAGNDFGQATVPTGLQNVVQIAAGFSHSLALRRDGTVQGWGDNFSGQISVPSNAFPLSAIAAGKEFSLGLRADGSLIGWGDNTYGQTNVPSIPGAVLSISAGYHHALALLMDGTIVGWGENSFGQATPPDGLANVVAISAGGLHSMALARNGAIVAWGDNTYGQLDVPASATNIIAVAAGYANSLALRADGTVLRWGRGGYVLRSSFVPPNIARVRLISAGYIDCVVATGPP